MRHVHTSLYHAATLDCPLARTHARQHTGTTHGQVAIVAKYVASLCIRKGTTTKHTTRTDATTNEESKLAHDAKQTPRKNTTHPRNEKGTG